MLSAVWALAAPTPHAQGPAPEPRQPFESFLQDVRREALERGISSATLDAALSGLAPDPVVVTRDRTQPEVVQSLDAYLAQRLSPRTITTARRMAVEHRQVLTRVEADFGVPSSLMVAVWGLESNFGRFTGTYPTIQALATLAYDNRRTLFRSELFAALTMIDRGVVDRTLMKGSWAGAMGQCQFIPTSFQAYAADGDGDGRKDIWGNKADVFASVVNYLRRVGWRPGLGWGQEVPPGTGVGKDMRIVRPAGPNGPAFATSENFRVILRWNQSDFFALAVGLLSDRIAAA